MGTSAAGRGLIFVCQAKSSVTSTIIQVGETARRKHFEKHWMVQSYNKPLAKEEEARLVQQDKDVKVIRRSWRKEERLKAEFEVNFPPCIEM